MTTGSRNTTVVMLALLLLGIGAWLVSANSEPRVGDANAIAARDAVESVTPASAAVVTRDKNEPPAPSRETAPDTTPITATEAASQHILRIRLRGLHPDAPWTTTLTLDAGERTTARLGEGPSTAVDSEGRAQFVLGDWITEDTKGAIRGDDPNYQPLRQSFEGPLDLSAELVVDVQVAGLLEGRVVASIGTPVANATVTTFELRSANFAGGLVARTSSDVTGRYSLRVPPGAPVLVVALPSSQLSVQLPEVRKGDASRADMPIDLRNGMLPASATATAVAGHPTLVRDLVMETATLVHGVVRWSDGTPLEAALVHAHSRDGEALEGAEKALYRLRDGRIASADLALSQSDGTFAIRAVAGDPVVLRIARIANRRPLGEWPEQTAVPPQNVEFVIPRPVTLRATRAGVAVAKARFECEAANGKNSFTGDDQGTFDIVVLGPSRVRASDERSCSAWTDVGPAAAGATVPLELVGALGTVSFEFEGGVHALVMNVEWRALDGRAGRDGKQTTSRNDESGSLTIHVDPGRYRMRVAPVIGDGSRFQLPVERDVEVGTEPVRIVLPAVFGGAFVLHATDGNGRHVPGTCRVLAANGDDVSDRFYVINDGAGLTGEIGKLITGGPNHFQRVLPAGEYELQCDFVEHGTRRERVTIKAREIAEVRIRL